MVSAVDGAKPKELDPAQVFLNKVSSFGAALSPEDSAHHQALLRVAGLVVGTGTALREPPGPRFAPLQLKRK